MSLAAALAGERRWWVNEGDCLAWLGTLPADSVDLVFGSPLKTRLGHRGVGVRFEVALSDAHDLKPKSLQVRGPALIPLLLPGRTVPIIAIYFNDHLMVFQVEINVANLKFRLRLKRDAASLEPGCGSTFRRRLSSFSVAPERTKCSAQAFGPMLLGPECLAAYRTGLLLANLFGSPHARSGAILSAELDDKTGKYLEGFAALQTVNSQSIGLVITSAAGHGAEMANVFPGSSAGHYLNRVATFGARNLPAGSLRGAVAFAGTILNL